MLALSRKVGESFLFQVQGEGAITEVTLLEASALGSATIGISRRDESGRHPRVVFGLHIYDTFLVYVGVHAVSVAFNRIRTDGRYHFQLSGPPEVVIHRAEVYFAALTHAHASNVLSTLPNA